MGGCSDQEARVSSSHPGNCSPGHAVLWLCGQLNASTHGAFRLRRQVVNELITIQGDVVQEDKWTRFSIRCFWFCQGWVGSGLANIAE